MDEQFETFRPRSASTIAPRAAAARGAACWWMAASSFLQPDLCSVKEPEAVEVSVRGAKQLALEVDFGEAEDQGDRVLWVEPRFVSRGRKVGRSEGRREDEHDADTRVRPGAGRGAAPAGHGSRTERRVPKSMTFRFGWSTSMRPLTNARNAFSLGAAAQAVSRSAQPIHTAAAAPADLGSDPVLWPSDNRSGRRPADQERHPFSPIGVPRHSGRTAALVGQSACDRGRKNRRTSRPWHSSMRTTCSARRARDRPCTSNAERDRDRFFGIRRGIEPGQRDSLQGGPDKYPVVNTSDETLHDVLISRSTPRGTANRLIDELPRPKPRSTAEDGKPAKPGPRFVEHRSPRPPRAIAGAPRCDPNKKPALAIYSPSLSTRSCRTGRMPRRPNAKRSPRATPPPRVKRLPR